MTDRAELDAARRRLLERRLRGADAPTGIGPVVPREDTGPVPISVSQAQLWFHLQVNPDSVAYNEMVTIRKDGEFDIDAFRRAFNEIVARYDSWHTAFVMSDAEPCQVVLPPREYELPLLDLSHVPFDEAERQAAQVAAEDTRRPYDLGRGHLLRPRLVRLATDHHRLYLGIHHLIFDGVTLYRILLPELVAVYDAFAAGRASPLSSLAIQYPDYARWERDWVRTEEVRRRIDRWRSRLSGVDGLRLPLDYRLPSRAQFAGQMLPLTIDSTTAARLHAVATEHHASLFHVLAAAYAWWLHRYSEQEVVPFATMCDLRQRPELSHLVGYCLTPLVLRGDVSDGPTLGDLVDRMRDETVGAMSDVVPFERLVRGLGVPRDPRRNPVFQVALVLEPPTTTPAPGWSLHQMETQIGSAVGQTKFDLGVEFDERPEGHIAGRFIYATQLFEAGTARQMAEHLTRLLTVSAANPDRTLADVDVGLCPAAATEPPLVMHRPLAHRAVLAQAERAPQSVAVVVGDERLTYGELAARAQATAQRLVAAGAGPGSVVAVHFDRSPDLVVGLLAVLLAGAAYLPLDPRQPAARTAFLVHDAGATLLLTRRALSDGASTPQLPIVLVDDPAPAAAIDPTTEAGPCDLAYVIYTSGSTGRPKGVLVEHRSLANLAATLLPRIGISTGDTVLSVASYTFDMSVGDIFGSLALGARLVLATDEQVNDPAALAALIASSGARLLSATPATWSLLVESGWPGASGLIASSGGEALSESLAEALLDRAEQVWNCYGPTETTDVVTCGRIERGEAVSVGRALDGTRVYVVDGNDQPTPDGVPGEILVGGISVARGYQNRPDETAQYFGDDPFIPGHRIYRTGDRGRWLADGRLRHLGRYDDQVKVRGYRIEPGEIEAVLCERDDVDAAAVVTREGPGGQRELVAYVGGSAADELAVRGWLRSRLPDYLVPTQLVCLPQLPLTPGRKVDRGALPPPPVTTAGSTDSRHVDRTPTERSLLALWSELLGREVTDVHADFFDLGGYSLLAARLILETRRRLGVEVSLAEFLERGTTVAGWAAWIDAAGSTQGPEQPTGTARSADPLFFVYPDLGSAVSVRHFTDAWGPAQPVVPLLPEQRYGRFDRSGGVEGLAAPILASIRQQQPHGPYALAGFSFGGLIAYDLARSLLAAGEQIRWLGLLDALSPVAARRFREVEPLTVRVARQLRRSPREQARKYVKVLRRPFVAAGLPAIRTAEDDQFDYRGALVLGRGYDRPGLPIGIDLFATDEAVTESGSDSLGWVEYHDGPIHAHRFGGGHSTLLDVPDVRRVAELIETSLRTAGGARRSG